MKSWPWLAGAAVVTGVLGALAGNMIGGNMIAQRGDTLGQVPRQDVATTRRDNDPRFARQPDSFAMETDEGTVELAELSTRGVDRERSEAAITYSQRAAPPPTTSTREAEQLAREALEPLPSAGPARVTVLRPESGPTAQDQRDAAIAAARANAAQVEMPVESPAPQASSKPPVTVYTPPPAAPDKATQRAADRNEPHIW